MKSMSIPVPMHAAREKCGPKFSGGKVQDDIKGIGVNGEPALVDTVHQGSAGDWL